MNSEDRKFYIDISEKLGRLQEGVANIWNLTEKQEQHLEKLNDSVAQNTKRSISSKIAVAYIKWVIGGVSLIIIGVVLKIMGVY